MCEGVKKFLDEDYKYIIFNDGKDWPDITNYMDVEQGKIGITKKCIELNIECINIPNQAHKKYINASQRHTDSLTFVLNYMKNNKDEYLMLDSDMFIIDYFNLNIYRRYCCACVIQERPRIRYIWGNFFYINMLTIKNLNLLNFNLIKGSDTGSGSSTWLKSLDNTDDIYVITHLPSGTWNETNIPSNINKILLNYLHFDKRNINNTFFCEIYDKKIFHYRAGSNWMNEKPLLHEQNITKLVNTINHIINTIL